MATYFNFNSVRMPEGRLLLVEDDFSLGFVTKDQLTAEGYDVDLAADGQEGWNKFRAGDYDLCLLDKWMRISGRVSKLAEMTI